MGSNLSVTEMLARLEAKIAHHKEKRDLHAAQEAQHAGQKEIHDAELCQAQERYEALKAAFAAAGETLAAAQPSPPPPPPPLKADDVRGRGRWVSRLMQRVIDTLPPGEIFGASRLIREIETRWGTELRQRVPLRSASSTLRRWAAHGRLQLVRDGTSHRESLYKKSH